MEARKTVQNTAASGGKESTGQFLEEMKGEFRKVDWTSKEELVLYTKLVVLATFFVGMGIYIVDLGIQGVLEVLHGLARWVG